MLPLLRLPIHLPLALDLSPHHLQTKPLAITQPAPLLAHHQYLHSPLFLLQDFVHRTPLRPAGVRPILHQHQQHPSRKNKQRCPKKCCPGQASFPDTGRQEMRPFCLPPTHQRLQLTREKRDVLNPLPGPRRTYKTGYDIFKWWRKSTVGITKKRDKI